MRGLAPEYYASPAVFAREQERIFGSLWLFMCLKLMVAKRGAYCARTLAGRSIVVQNVDGEIGCFLNVCAHRNAQIEPDGFGVRSFVCGYHGFRYAGDGCVANIPLESTHYAFSDEERACLRLRRFALREVGQLLFVNFAEAPLPIERQFSEPLLRELADVSSYFDTEVIHASTSERYNWKLPGENLRDALHPRFLHPQSLFPYVDFETAAHARADPNAPTSLHDVSFGGADGVPKKPQSAPYWGALEPWPHASERYYNWLLYPNLHIVSPDGCRTFGIEQYDPVAVDRTRLDHFMLTTRRREPLPQGPAILRGLLRSARGVLDEDARMMESVQRGFSSIGPPLRHGAYEGDLVRFATLSRDRLRD